MTENTQQHEFTIDIFALLKTLWRNAALIILVAAISGAIMFAYTLFRVEPQYQATATLYVNKSSFSLGDANFMMSTNLNGTALVDIYMIIIQSRTTLEEVIEEADLGMTSKELGGMIEAKGLTDGAFSISVTCNDPAQAELIANTLAKILPDRIADIIDGTSTRIIDYAIIPAKRSSPDYIRSTAIGILAGAALCSAIVMVSSLFKTNANSAISSADELRDLFPDVPVLASIPDMRSSSKKASYYSAYYGEDKGKKGKKGKEGK